MAVTAKKPAPKTVAAKPAVAKPKPKAVPVEEVEEVEVEQEAAEEGMTSEDDDDALVVDMENVEEGSGFEVRPRGKYPCTIYELEFGRSQRSNNPMWTVTLEVEEGHQYAGSRFFTHVTFNEGGLPRAKRFLSNIGRSDLAASQFSPKLVADEGELVGLRCTAVVVIRPYEGEKRNSVRDVLAPEGESEGGFVEEGEDQ
jgi:hypothetical protein